MNNDNFEIFAKKLTDFGLSKTEASIYLYLLRHGKETGGSNVAIATKLHRQYVYNALPHLIELKLVEEIPRGKQNKYKAMPPQIIERIARNRAISATDLAHDLNSISNIGNEQEFEVIQGEKAMLEYEMDYVLSTPENTEELIIGGASGGFLKIMGNNLSDYLSIKEDKSILVRYLGSKNEINEFERATKKYTNQTHRFLEELPEGTANMVIRPSSVCFFSYAHPPHVYVVKSNAVADHYRKFFEMLWNMSKEQRA